MIRQPLLPTSVEPRAALGERLDVVITSLRQMLTGDEGREPWLPIEHDTAAEALGMLLRVRESLRVGHRYTVLP